MFILCVKSLIRKIKIKNYYRYYHSKMDTIQENINSEDSIALQDAIILENIRKETIIKYCTHQYDLAEAVRQILTNYTDKYIENLDEIHCLPQTSEMFLNRRKIWLNNLQVKWNLDRGRTDDASRELFLEFDLLYKKFIAEVVGPRMGGGRIIYQHFPTLRVNVPNEVGTVALHDDREYHHQPSEINFWLPLTTCFGNNSLWVESEPRKGDFHSLDMQYGELYRFYGNQCRHYTNANNTNKTRVSLDFRVVSTFSGSHDPTFCKGVRRGSKSKYQRYNDVGGYYDELTIPISEHLI